MKRTILQIGNPILEQKTKFVTDFKDKQFTSLVEDMLDICKNNLDTTAGLSAPQVGDLSAVCICRRTDLEELKGEKSVKSEDLWEVIVNPIIEFKSNEQSTFWEACLSIGVGPNQLWGPVSRSSTVKITYQNKLGESKSLVANGFFSHIVQHELDHLDGILFLRYIKNPANIWKSIDIDRYMDKTGTFPPIKD